MQLVSRGLSMVCLLLRIEGGSGRFLRMLVVCVLVVWRSRAPRTAVQSDSEYVCLYL